MNIYFEVTALVLFSLWIGYKIGRFFTLNKLWEHIKTTGFFMIDDKLYRAIEIFISKERGARVELADLPDVQERHAEPIASLDEQQDEPTDTPANEPPTTPKKTLRRRAALH